MIRRTVYGLVAVILLWSTARFCHHQTKGFRLEKLQNNTGPFVQRLSPPMTQEVKTLLQQRFTYLGRGHQSFAFVSQDGETVLKLFINRYQTRLKWLNLLPNFGPWKKWRAERIKTNHGKWEKTFRSYQIAEDILRKESRLIYLHPQKDTHGPTWVTVIDPLAIQHEIDLSQMGFALQQKVVPSYEYLAKCVKQNEVKVAQQAIQGIVQLIHTKMERGLIDHDPLIRTNVGFYGDQPVQIDLGAFTLEERSKNFEAQKEKTAKIVLSLRHWLENNHPELVGYLNEALMD